MHDNPKVPVVAAIPGGGWQASFATEGEDFQTPIVAWLVYADGELEPVSVDGLGCQDDPTSVGNFQCLIPPPKEAAR